MSCPENLASVHALASALNMAPTIIAERAAQYVPRVAQCGSALRLGDRHWVASTPPWGRDVLGQMLATRGAKPVVLGRSERFIAFDKVFVRPGDFALATGWAREGGRDAIVSTDGEIDRLDQGATVGVDLVNPAARQRLAKIVCRNLLQRMRGLCVCALATDALLGQPGLRHSVCGQRLRLRRDGVASSNASSIRKPVAGSAVASAASIKADGRSSGARPPPFRSGAEASTLQPGVQARRCGPLQRLALATGQSRNEPAKAIVRRTTKIWSPLRWSGCRRRLRGLPAAARRWRQTSRAFAPRTQGSRRPPRAPACWRKP